jgi:hypothetical protein
VLKVGAQIISQYIQNILSGLHCGSGTISNIEWKDIMPRSAKWQFKGEAWRDNWGCCGTVLTYQACHTAQEIWEE